MHSLSRISAKTLSTLDFFVPATLTALHAQNINCIRSLYSSPTLLLLLTTFSNCLISSTTYCWNPLAVLIFLQCTWSGFCHKSWSRPSSCFSSTFCSECYSANHLILEHLCLIFLFLSLHSSYTFSFFLMFPSFHQFSLSFNLFLLVLHFLLLLLLCFISGVPCFFNCFVCLCFEPHQCFSFSRTITFFFHLRVPVFICLFIVIILLN